MKLIYLRDFVAVARLGSTHAAARHLNIAQPSIIKNLQTLERELGTAMFERTSRGAVLTQAGTVMLRHAENVLQELRRAVEDVRQSEGDRGGEIAFGISSGPAIGILSPVLTRFETDYPDVQIRIISSHLPISMPELSDGSLDFMVCPNPGKDLDADFSSELLFESLRVPVCRMDHPLCRVNDLADLLDSPWLVTSIGNNPIGTFEELFAARGLQPPTRLTICDASLAIAELLINSDMICWLPSQWTTAVISGGYLTQINIPEHAADIWQLRLIQRSALKPTPAADTLMMAIRDFCQGL